MKTANLARIYINIPIVEGDFIRLSKQDSHYISSVMRKKIDDYVIIFNGFDGEWLSKIVNNDKNSIILEVVKLQTKQERANDLHLIFAIIKSPRLQFMIEKITELGVTNIIPIVTDHCVADKINLDKMKIWVKEAAEQSLRLSVPTIQNPTSLQTFLSSWPADNKIILCNEKESENKLEQALHLSGLASAIMIGPEGGFSAREHEMLKNSTNIINVQMGPRILRAETAAIAALSVYQATVGDWNYGPRKVCDE